MKQESHENLREYYTFGFPLLLLMVLIALAGVGLTVAARYFF